MTTSQDLLELVGAALTATPATTAAGDRVYQPGDWPTQSGQYPIIKLRLATEDRQSIGRSGAAEFTTLAGLQILGEVSMPAEAGNAGAAKAEAALWSLKRQIEIAVVNGYALTAQIQQIASMRSQIAFDASSGTHLATLQIDLALEFYEGAESFAPVEACDLNELTFADTTLTPSPGFVADINP